MHNIKQEVAENIGKIKSFEKKHESEIMDMVDKLEHSFSKIYDAAIRDDKTGLYNNRFFNSIFEMELERARRTKEKFCLIIIDIDFFKKINDTYGHDVGDEVLKALSNVMKKELRKYDLLSRFGGEEFFILLPGEKIKKAEEIGERLRVSLWNDKKLKKYAVTISLGVTEYKSKDNKIRMIRRADKALYVSKHKGRNQLNVFL